MSLMIVGDSGQEGAGGGGTKGPPLGGARCRAPRGYSDERLVEYCPRECPVDCPSNPWYPLVSCLFYFHVMSFLLPCHW